MGRRGMHMGYWWEHHKERDHWVGNIKTDLRESGLEGMDWIDLAEDRAQWRALVKTVINLLVP
jgi:hypothetical protein